APADVAHDVAADMAPDLAPDMAPDLAPDAMAFMDLPGCATAGAYTVAANLTPTINFGGSLGENYAPKCLKVAKTAQVPFAGMGGDTFGDHPLRPSTVAGASPNNPITATSSGGSK